MLPTSPAGTAALYILRQSTAQPSGQVQAAYPTQPNREPEAPGIEGDRYFGMNAMDITAMKVRLMERLGEKFGIAMEDHPDARSFGMAIRAVVEKLKMSTDGMKLLGQVEKDLGLDDLGISIDTLIGAIVDPAGNDAERLDAALKEQAGEAIEDGSEMEALDRLARMGLDDAGLYGA